jgi:hypothetical protein
MDLRSPGTNELDPHAGDPPTYADSNPDSGGLPRWVKLAGILVVIVLLLVLSMMLLGGGHSPVRHF